jgi:hypothetical protein
LDVGINDNDAPVTQDTKVSIDPIDTFVQLFRLRASGTIASTAAALIGTSTLPDRIQAMQTSP